MSSLWAQIRKNIPKGKYRVVAFDPYNHGYQLVKDCDTVEEAFTLADERNRQRTDAMDDVHYVYDDQGNFLRGEEAINNSEVTTAVRMAP